MPTYGPAVAGDPRLRTEDGVEIVDGGRYWNYYDLHWVTVRFGDSMSLSPTGRYWDGWFQTELEDGTRGPTLDGSRMCSYRTTP